MTNRYYDYGGYVVTQSTINSEGKYRTVSRTFTGKVPLLVHVYIYTLHALREERGKEGRKPVGRGSEKDSKRKNTAAIEGK